MGRIAVMIFMVAGSIALATLFSRLHSKSLRLHWIVFSTFMAPAAVFIMLRFTSSADPHSFFGQVAAGLWSIAIIGLIFSKFARALSFSEHPIAFVIFGILVYVLTAFAIITAGVNLGLMEP